MAACLVSAFYEIAVRTQGTWRESLDWRLGALRTKMQYSFPDMADMAVCNLAVCNQEILSIFKLLSMLVNL